MLDIVFVCGVRGYHQYRTIWSPVFNEVLPARPEQHNPHDCYAIAVTKHFPGTLAESVVGHLPREISRLTYFLIMHGARASCKVMDVHYRRSPLIQGGLEISVEVTGEMDISEENVLALEKYKVLIEGYYQEPMDGKFPDATASISEKLKDGDDVDDDVEKTDNEDD